MGSSGRHRIKVGLCSPFFFPVMGGAQSATLNLARELSPYCDVEIHTVNTTTQRDRKCGLELSSSLPEEETVDGIQVHRYPYTNLPIVSDFSLRMINNISHSDVDILHFQGVSRPFNRLLLHGACRGKVCILTTHTLHESIQIVMKSRGGHLIRSLFIASLRGMNHIIATSNADEMALVRLGLPAEKITIMPNGIDISKFSQRNKFVRDNDRLKILCVGRFDRNKNYESLVNVVQMLRDRGIDLEAYFVGSIGEYAYFEEISRLIHKKGLESRIKIAVSLPDPYLADCYFSCDVFVLPSTTETLPLVIPEAMYAGLPIVATNVGGVSEMVKEDRNGFLVSPNDPESLYEKCLELLENDSLRKKFGAISRKMAADYSWPKIAASTFRLYEQLLQGKQDA